MNASAPRTPRRRASTGRRPPAGRTPTSSSSAAAAAAAAASPATATPGRGSRGLFVDGQWFCDCTPRRPAALRETRKPGANRGRWFYTCPQDRRHQCSFFVWEDYAGAVQDGAGAAGAAAAAAAAAAKPLSSARPARSAPRPSYRTSIGRRTTPPGERHEEIRVPVAQLPLPPAPLPASSTRRNRTFTTPTGGRLERQYAVMEEEGGDDDDDSFHDPLPPTPTPARTHAGRSGPRASEAPAPAPAPAHEPPSQRITQYFGVVRRSDRMSGGSAEKPPDAATPTRSTRKRSGAIGSRSAGPAAAAPVRAASPVAKREASDYSDSGVDSDMERALVALADHSERAIARSRRGAAQEAEDDDDPDRMDADTDTGTDTRRAGGIVVPVPLDRRASRPDARLATAATAEAPLAPGATDTAAAPPSPSPTPRRRRGLLIASDEYAAAAAHHHDHRHHSPPPSAPGTDSANTSFASVFSRPPAWLASSQDTQASQASAATTAAITPPSSLQSSGGFGSGSGGGGGVAEYRTRPRDTQGRFASDGAEGDGADSGNAPGEDDPFTSTPSRRVRFARDGRPSGSALFSSPSSSRRPQRWDEDHDMHVDGEDGAESKHSPGGESQADSHGDHPVTATVLQLLADQPVAPRVREKVRNVLNESFSS